MGGHLDRVHAARAAEREEREGAGSMPRSTEMTRMAFSMLALAMATTPSAVSTIDFPIARPSRQTPPRSSRKDLHPAAQKEIRVQAPETKIGVGHGRKIALAVAGGARIGARAFRTDPKRAAAVGIGDRAAARADRMDVDDGQPDGKVADPVSWVLRMPPSMRDTSVEVPPMSKLTTLGKPAARARSGRRRPLRRDPKGPSGSAHPRPGREI